jgi:hypothetical protein
VPDRAAHLDAAVAADGQHPVAVDESRADRDPALLPADPRLFDGEAEQEPVAFGGVQVRWDGGQCGCGHGCSSQVGGAR